jgi:carbon-monoxide dehydrogenase small subunit
MSLKLDITLNLNGTKVNAVAGVADTALELLRREFDLGGTKLACGEGECGACTIIVDGRSRNSCLVPAVDLDGREVMTIEGLWTEEGVDPVQQAFIDKGAVQCGFCTPGMIMQTRYLLNQNPDITEDEVIRGLEGNICRCTGYKKIITAALAASKAERVSAK